MGKKKWVYRKNGQGQMGRRNPATLRAANRRLREKNRAWAIAYLGGACAACGATDTTFEFDHLPGSGKVTEVTCLLTNSRERILAELVKCQLVCTDCHDALTEQRRNCMEVSDDVPF